MAYINDVTPKINSRVKMRMYIAVLLLSAEPAVAALVPAPSAPAPAAQTEAVIPNDWAAAPPPDKALIRRAIKESFDEEKAVADAESKEKAIPYRYSASSHAEQDKYEKFETTFADAKVPGCLSHNGLKRQSTFIFRGLLALPFVAVAAVRGKCN